MTYTSELTEVVTILKYHVRSDWLMGTYREKLKHILVGVGQTFSHLLVENVGPNSFLLQIVQNCSCWFVGHTFSPTNEKNSAHHQQF